MLGLKVATATVILTFVLIFTTLSAANGQEPQIPMQCATTIKGGIVIIDLTCKGNTITIRALEDLGYMVMVQTATEIQMQPTTDTIKIMKEKGIDLNYTFTPP